MFISHFFDNSLDFNSENLISHLQERTPFSQFFWVNQVHSNTCVRIHDFSQHNKVKADAMVSTIKNVGFIIKTADCQAIQIYDPEFEEIGHIHAGWRGLVNGVIENTIDEMKGDPAQFQVVCGPSLRMCCSEFSDPMNEIPKKFHAFVEGKNVDLQNIAKNIFLTCGMQKKNITFSEKCTKCYTHNSTFPYFSHRRGEAGRLVSVIGLQI